MSLKIEHNRFFQILRECGGLYSKTARAITKEIGESYSRQSVKERAENYPDLLDDIVNEVLDIAEEGVQDIMQDKKNRNTQLRACEFYLRTKGKERGYVERSEYAEHVEQPLFDDEENDENGTFEED